jgi:hypothetical protein
MTPLKTIAATALVAVAGTVVAFGGLHLGQPSADAATAHQPVKATTHAMTSTTTQRAHLMHKHDQDSGTTARAKHPVRQVDQASG